MPTSTLLERAARHAALGDPTRLAVAEQLMNSDRSPQDLLQRLGITSNLLSHHLDVLEGVGLIARGRSSGDGRRRYVHLLPAARRYLRSPSPVAPGPALFVCTANSARSQLAAALWETLFGERAASAGTKPAPAVHPGALAAASRAGLKLVDARPKPLSELGTLPSLVITVCDRAHEELLGDDGWLHWSIPDPVPEGTSTSFDRTVSELSSWMRGITQA